MDNMENSQIDSRDMIPPSLDIPEHACNHRGLKE